MWKQVRPNEARGESKESYATPIPFEHDGKTGLELWRAGGWNPDKINHWRMVTSPVVADGLAIACAPKNGSVIAVRPNGAGDVTASQVAWRSNGRELTSDVCVPLYYQGNLYVLDGDRKTLSCVEPKTGKKKWSGSLGGDSPSRASIVAVDGEVLIRAGGRDRH